MTSMPESLFSNGLFSIFFMYASCFGQTGQI